MKKTIAIALGLALLAPPNVADARWADRDAKHACKQKARDQYDATHFHGVIVSRKGNDDFDITGVAERRGRSDVPFRCKIRNGNVMSMTSTSSGGGSSTGAAAAGVVAGAVLGAVLLGALSKDHKHDHHREHKDWRDGRHHKDHKGSGDRHSRRDSGAFSPRSGVTCHNYTRMCYSNGRYDPRATRRHY